VNSGVYGSIDAAASARRRSFMRAFGRRSNGLALALVGATLAFAGSAASAGAATKVTWMKGYAAPGTPAKLNKVGVIKVGPEHAKNVLVLEPGTSAGAGYFVPFAKWVAAHSPGWQVWSVERRENLLEDQSVFDLAKQGKATSKEVFDYYLGFLADPSITRHLQPVADPTVGYARQWGMRVAVEDLHRVIAAAHEQGGQVVLGGHSLGGSVVTAYATWDFQGRAGADELAGLVYDDGGSRGAPVTAAQATQSLQTLQAGSPWLAFSGIPAPYLGLFSTAGSTGALIDPDSPSLGQAFPLLPAALKPPVTATNLGLFGFATDTKTSKLNFSAQAHLGQLDTSVSPAGWNGTGAITPIQRYATMLSGNGTLGADGTEWYFPERLTIDTGAVAGGIDNPAQKVLGLRSTHGRDLPKRLRIYAFGAFGGQGILDAAKILAGQSHIPARNLTLIDRQGAYAHNDPAAAYPKNAFYDAMLPFLAKLGKRGPS
jgi:pimeloyl-ACP methyl ester carboxylesterase